MLETADQEIHAYSGLDADSSLTAIPQHVYTKVCGMIPANQLLRRVGGKALHTDFNNPIISIVQMEDKFVVQAYDEIQIVDI